MNRKQLRAIATYHNQKESLPRPSGYAVSLSGAPRDKYRGTYKLASRGGIVPTQWIGRSNSIATNSPLTMNESGNKLWAKN